MTQKIVYYFDLLTLHWFTKQSHLKGFILILMDNKKLSEDPSTKELNQFVQTMLKQMQERFDNMSSNIIGRVDEMGKQY